MLCSKYNSEEHISKTKQALTAVSMTRKMAEKDLLRGVKVGRAYQLRLHAHCDYCTCPGASDLTSRRKAILTSLRSTS